MPLQEALLHLGSNVFCFCVVSFHLENKKTTLLTIIIVFVCFCFLMFVLVGKL